MSELQDQNALVEDADLDAVDWRRIDDRGYLYGFHWERDSVWRADVTVPGRGRPRQEGPGFAVFVDGAPIGVEASLDAAKALAASFFRTGCHHPQMKHLWPGRAAGEGCR